jgi:hypothetical protein
MENRRWYNRTKPQVPAHTYIIQHPDFDPVKPPEPVRPPRQIWKQLGWLGLKTILIFGAIMVALVVYDRAIQSSVPQSFLAQGALPAEQSLSVIQAANTNFSIRALSALQDHLTVHGMLPNGTMAALALTEGGLLRTQLVDEVMLEVGVNVVYANDTDLAQDSTLREIRDLITTLLERTPGPFSEIVWTGAKSTGAVSNVYSPGAIQCTLVGGGSTSTNLTIQDSLDGTTFFTTRHPWSTNVETTHFSYSFIRQTPYFRVVLGAGCTFTPYLFLSCV